MRTTKETDEMAKFRHHVTRALGPHARIMKDPEGWPMAPGKLGHLEWRGEESCAPGRDQLYVFTDRRVIGGLRSIHGVIPKQIGEQEAVFRVAADDRVAIQEVASLLKIRRRRASSTGASASHMALMRALKDAKQPLGRSKTCPGITSPLEQENRP